MSALAARRAAAAASAVIDESMAGESVPSTSGAKVPSKTVRSAVSSKGTINGKDGTPPSASTESAPGPSKRRKIATAPKKASGAQSGSTVELEVHADPEHITSQPSSKGAGKRKQKRAFSPSRPVEEYDAASSQGDEQDSSDEDRGAPGSEQIVERDGRDVRWSLPSSTPGQTPGTTPGPSQYTNHAPHNGAGYSKSFTAKEGINVHRLTAEQVRTLGLRGDEEGLLIALQPTESLMLSGCFSIVPLRGSLSLFSSSLSPSNPHIAYPVFAPLSHPLPVINPSPSTSASFSSPTSAASDSFISTFFQNPLEGTATILILRELCTGLEGMTGGAIPTFSNSFSPSGGFSGVWDLPPDPSYPYTTPESWTSALQTLRPSPAINGDTHEEGDMAESSACPVVIVKGPKRSGKSSIGRAALNALLERYEKVAWLECDLGQSEFGAGGVVGLWILDRPIFGPPFTHLCVPRRAHFLGTYTPVTCPSEYLDAVSHIAEYYKYEIQYSTSATTAPSDKRWDVVPIVINTPGWVKGIGEDLLRALESLLDPTHTFQFPLPPYGAGEAEEDRPGWTSSPPSGYATLPTVPAGSGVGTEKVVLAIPPAPVLPLQARYAASDHRQLSMLSYFYSHLPPRDSKLSLKWDFGTPLAIQPPYEITIGETIKEIYLIGEGADGIIADDLGLALNGALVALLERLSPSAGTEVPRAYIQGRPCPSLEECNFLGYAFIRAVQVSHGELQKLHLLTPLPADVLARVSIVVRNGAMEMPNPGMIDWTSKYHGQAQRGVPFFDDGPLGVGGERRKIRRNLMRKGM